MAEYNGGKPDAVFIIPIGSGKKFRRFDAWDSAESYATN